jgi:hypothetical protein
MAIRFSGLPGMPAEELPFFMPLSNIEMRAEVCPYVLTKCDGIVSAYDHENYVIHYLDTFDTRSIEDNSFLVHELVHVLQHRAHLVPKPLTCEAVKRIEIQAYAAQNAYLKYWGSEMRQGRSAETITCEDQLKDKY